MRFMVIVKASKNSEAGVLPSAELLVEMGKFNDELTTAGVMLAGEGLQASSKGARVRFSGTKRTVINGPFAETKELVAGFWIWKCKSLQEAIEWVKRCPNPMPGEEAEIEIRQVFEIEDFGAQLNPEPRAEEVYERTLRAGGPSSGETRDLVFTRVFDAPVERVWNAWTDPEHVKLWWGPDRFTCPSARIDFREGGISLVCMRAPKEFGGQDMYSTWTYTKIVPLKEIEYLHHFADRSGNKVTPATLGLPPDMPEEVRNLVAFNAVGANKTRLTVTEYDWPVGQMMEMSKLGMEQCLDKMVDSFMRP